MSVNNNPIAFSQYHEYNLSFLRELSASPAILEAAQILLSAQ